MKREVLIDVRSYVNDLRCVRERLLGGRTFMEIACDLAPPGRQHAIVHRVYSTEWPLGNEYTPLVVRCDYGWHTVQHGLMGNVSVLSESERKVARSNVVFS